MCKSILQNTSFTKNTPKTNPITHHKNTIHDHAKAPHTPHFPHTNPTIEFHTFPHHEEEPNNWKSWHRTDSCPRTTLYARILKSGLACASIRADNAHNDVWYAKCIEYTVVSPTKDCRRSWGSHCVSIRGKKTMCLKVTRAGKRFEETWSVDGWTCGFSIVLFWFFVFSGYLRCYCNQLTLQT